MLFRFGRQLSEHNQYLVRQYSRTRGRVENLFSQIPKNNIISSTNEDENDLSHPLIVAFSSIENQISNGFRNRR
jgi:hypothetical protein